MGKRVKRHAHVKAGGGRSRDDRDLDGMSGNFRSSRRDVVQQAIPNPGRNKTIGRSQAQVFPFLIRNQRSDPDLVGPGIQLALKIIADFRHCVFIHGSSSRCP